MAEKQDWLDALDPKDERHRRPVDEPLTRTRWITQDEANEWLLRVDEQHQRNLGEAHVKRLRIDMDAEDSWVSGTNILVFDRKARLINGQHTLAAFAGSNRKKLYVVWQINMHPNAYIGFDYNRKRSAADALKWDGHERANEKKAAAIVIWQYESGFFSGKAFRAARGGQQWPTASQVKKTLAAHPGLENHLWKNPFRGKGFSVGAMNAASYIFHAIDQKRGEEFFEMFIEGIRFQTPRDPINVLRKEFMGMGERERERNGVTLLKFFKAWNAHLRNDVVPGVLIRQNDVFEEPVHPGNLTPRLPARPGGRPN